MNEYRTRICERPDCQTEYTPSGSNSRYCCDECKTEAKRAVWRKANRQRPHAVKLPQMPKAKCPICGAVFRLRSAGQVLCTPECEGVAAMRKRITASVRLRSCLMCDKIFMSAGPWNRRCPGCEAVVQQEESYQPKVYQRGSGNRH